MALALTAAPASAQEGNGPYDPFPTPASPETTPRFFGDLGLDVHAAALRNGRFLAGLQATRDDAASRRAGLDTGDDADTVVVLALVAVVAAGAGAAIAIAGSRRRAGPS